MAQTKEQAELPTTLDAALEVIADMRVSLGALQSEVEDLKGELEDSQSEVSDLEDELREVRDEDPTWLPPEAVTDLVRIRHAIKRGTVNDDHVYQLEKLLSELDSGWMCRA